MLVLVSPSTIETSGYRLRWPIIGGTAIYQGWKAGEVLVGARPVSPAIVPTPKPVGGCKHVDVTTMHEMSADSCRSSSSLNSTYPQRRHSRLVDFDYAAFGAYFFTVCTHNRACILGDAIEYDVHLNPLGVMVASAWNDIPNHFTHVQLDQFIVMPNHVHGILWIESAISAPAKDTPQPAAHHNRPTQASLAAIVGSFKARATRQCRHEMMLPLHARLWQRGYYDHVIRSDTALERIREYIANNPARWDLDAENPARRRK